MAFNHVLLALKMIIVSCITDFSLLSLTLMNLFTIIAHKRNPYEQTQFQRIKLFSKLVGRVSSLPQKNNFYITHN